ncbi:FtsX-like permease family protein [Sporolactobacillus laevolacticus]|uniref:FtsX-like permease family protein n=1 Tax=Sporolactobacillus laevolacticus TaxID=33018 RepID=UPI0025B3673F|nr:ABC transporter permease [Sporolactobacillus laevolacticus]MDN3954587.1 ABC transporter permease [Sporolactobacillus laevolacticus]
MTFFRFALNNVRRSPKVYGPYFFSSFFAVSMFFVYALLVFHPDFAGEIQSVNERMSLLAMIGFQISQVVIVIFSSFAVFYAVSAFLKTRRYEFGILFIQGLSRKQMIRLIFIENVVTGFAAIICGILFGFAFSKVILLVCSNLLAMDRTLAFYFPWKPMVVTFLVFSAMFVLISLLTTVTVRTSHVRALIDSKRVPKKAPRANVTLAILAIVLILAGYGLVLKISNGLSFSFLPLFGGVILVVIGTYFFFSQLLVFLLRVLQKREGLYFHRTNLLALSELIYRMQDNIRALFIVAIIFATAVTAVGTSMAIGNSELTTEISSPYALTYMSSKPIDVGLVDDAEHELQTTGINDYRKANGRIYNTNIIDLKGSTGELISNSDYNQLLALQKKQPVHLKKDETILVPYTAAAEKRLHSSALPEKMNLRLKGSTYTVKVKDVVAMNRFPALIGVYSENPYAFVSIVADEVINQLDQLKKQEVFVMNYAVIHTSEWEKTLPAARKIEADYMHYTHSEKFTKNGFYIKFDSLALNWQRTKQLNGLLLLLTVLCGIVFYTFAAGFLYLRLYSDQKRDISQYQMLHKIGLKQSELKKVVTDQLAFLFFLPMLVAIVHSSVAFIALHNLIHFSITGSVIVIIGAFLVIQAVYFFVVRHHHLRLLQQYMTA